MENSLRNSIIDYIVELDHGYNEVTGGEENTIYVPKQGKHYELNGYINKRIYPSKGDEEQRLCEDESDINLTAQEVVDGELCGSIYDYKG